MDFGAKGNSELRKIPVDMPKQSSRAIPRKRCSENMRQNTHVEVRFQQNCQATSYFFQFILTITVFYGAAIKIAVYSKCVCCFSIFMSHLAYMSILLSKKKKKKKNCFHDMFRSSHPEVFLRIGVPKICRRNLQEKLKFGITVLL